MKQYTKSQSLQVLLRKTLSFVTVAALMKSIMMIQKKILVYSFKRDGVKYLSWEDLLDFPLMVKLDGMQCALMYLKMEMYSYSLLLTLELTVMEFVANSLVKVSKVLLMLVELLYWAMIL